MRPPKDLLETYFDGELTEEESRTLGGWLAEDRENLRQFAQEAHLHYGLRQVATQATFLEQTAQPETPRPQIRARLVIWLRTVRHRWIAGCALALAVATTIAATDILTRSFSPADTLTLRTRGPGVHLIRNHDETVTTWNTCVGDGGLQNRSRNGNTWCPVFLCRIDNNCSRQYELPPCGCGFEVPYCDPGAPHCI